MSILSGSEMWLSHRINLAHLPGVSALPDLKEIMFQITCSPAPPKKRPKNQKRSFVE